MEESLSAFPFRRLRYDKYLILEVMLYVESVDEWKFIYSLNLVDFKIIIHTAWEIQETIESNHWCQFFLVF